MLGRVAVIGAGLAGLACARTLADRGVPVTVVDKGRGPGGRTSSRRAGELRFDHGAPKLDLASPRLVDHVRAWEKAGVIARVGSSWIGTPSSSALAAHLSRGLTFETGARVTALQGDDAGWRLMLASGPGRGPFEAVVVTAPAPQAIELFATTGVASAITAPLAAVAYAPCLAAMITFAAPDDSPADEVRATEVLGGAWRMAARAGRPDDRRAWVAHGTAAWSAAHLEADPDASARGLAAELASQIGGGELASVVGHRWRYARVTRPLEAPCVFDRRMGLGYASDACAFDEPTPSAARAVLAGIAVANRLLGASTG